MTIKENTLKPELLESHEVDFGTSITMSIWAKVANYHNWVDSSIPIGFLLYFHGSQTLALGSPITPPNPDLWVLCNGQQIVDSFSPLNGQFTPDLRLKYLKGGSTSGAIGGATTVNIAHTHGTNLVSENDESGRSNARAGGDYRAGSPHTHTVNSQWSSAEPIIPPTYELQIYMRKR